MATPTPAERVARLERENAALREALTTLAEQAQQLWYAATAALAVAGNNHGFTST